MWRGRGSRPFEEESSTRIVEVLTQPGDFSMKLLKFLVLRIMTWLHGSKSCSGYRLAVAVASARRCSAVSRNM